ncbi:type-1 angiotensin II receptor-associated protein [Rhodnius prolixus]
MEASQFENFFREPNVSLKGAFYGHLIFLSWALITNWSPSAYFFYNILFLILLLWGIAAKGNVEPLEMAQIVNIISLVLDIFVVSIFFPRSGIGVKMSACMAIINILIRPVTLSILRNEIRYRRDGGTGNFPNTFGSHYQDIDSTPGTP